MTTAITTIRKDRYAVEPGNDLHTFTVGAHYYGGLTCAHGEHKLLCTKRTAKSVWLASYVPEYMTYDGVVQRGESYELPRRSKIKWSDYCGKLQETTVADGWMVDADGIARGDEPNTY